MSGQLGLLHLLYSALSLISCSEKRVSILIERVVKLYLGDFIFEHVNFFRVDPLWFMCLFEQCLHDMCCLLASESCYHLWC